ncbi:hypothetical protein [Streptomyces sp. NPDC059639]|uniref:hypothetical protein n=1 Tax=Streptomyces sp. NPDC059639 TaxID=3346891 RepID=UPI0036A69A4D
MTMEPAITAAAFKDFIVYPFFDDFFAIGMEYSPQGILNARCPASACSTIVFADGNSGVRLFIDPHSKERFSAVNMKVRAHAKNPPGQVV